MYYIQCICSLGGWFTIIFVDILKVGAWKRQSGKKGYRSIVEKKCLH